MCRLYLAGKDPGGCHGSPLTSAFEQAEKRPGEALDANFAFFWDVGSLFQPPRTERETALIEAGMHTSTVWYGHAKTPVWMQSELPPGVVGRSYQDSGWCFLEAAISAAVKPSDLRIDLAMRPRGQFGLGREDRRYTFSGIPLDSMPSQQVKVYGGVDYAQPGTLVSTCKARRLPPLTPDEMHRQLIEEKQFTEDSDRVTVSAIYRAFFETVTRPCTCLSFNHSGWGAASLGLLCLSLPHFETLTSWTWASTSSDRRVASSLVASSAPALRSTSTHLNLHACLLCGVKLGRGQYSSAGIKALANSLCVNTRLKAPKLTGNNIASEGGLVLATALRTNTTLTHLDLTHAPRRSGRFN